MEIKQGDRRNFNTQQDLLKMSWERLKAYSKEHNYLNGTTVKPENEGNSNFDSEIFPSVHETLYLKVLIAFLYMVT